MATEIHKERIVRTDGELSTEDTNPVATTVVRIISTLFGILIALLSLRILLSLLGANRSNVFADAIYSLTQPFVRPFAGLFSVDDTIGRVRFEFETLFAIFIYSLVAWLLIRLVGIAARSDDPERV